MVSFIAFRAFDRPSDGSWEKWNTGTPVVDSGGTEGAAIPDLTPALRAAFIDGAPSLDWDSVAKGVAASALSQTSCKFCGSKCVPAGLTPLLWCMSMSGM